MNYGNILRVKYPGKLYTLDDVSDYKTLNWLDAAPKPSRATLDSLDAEVTQLMADEAATMEKHKRMQRVYSFQEQLLILTRQINSGAAASTPAFTALKNKIAEIYG